MFRFGTGRQCKGEAIRVALPGRLCRSSYLSGILSHFGNKTVMLAQGKRQTNL
jgi:hypothetical protein